MMVKDKNVDISFENVQKNRELRFRKKMSEQRIRARINWRKVAQSGAKRPKSLVFNT